MLLRRWVLMEAAQGIGGSKRTPTLDEALAIIERGEPWEPSDPMFSLLATDAGETAYRKHNNRRLHHRVGFNSSEILR